MSPARIGRPCVQPGCPEPAVYRGRCTIHARVHEHKRQQRRGPRVYDTTQWREVIRPQKLAKDPLCQIRTHCNGAAATEVDHIDGDQWNNAPGNLRSTCHDCHSARTARDQSFEHATPKPAAPRRRGGWIVA